MIIIFIKLFILIDLYEFISLFVKASLITFTYKNLRLKMMIETRHLIRHLELMTKSNRPDNNGKKK